MQKIIYCNATGADGKVHRRYYEGDRDGRRYRNDQIPSGRIGTAETGTGRGDRHSQSKPPRRHNKGDDRRIYPQRFQTAAATAVRSAYRKDNDIRGQNRPDDKNIRQHIAERRKTKICHQIHKEPRPERSGFFLYVRHLPRAVRPRLQTDYS